MTRYLIAGAGGMLGHDLQRSLAGRDVTALGHADLDISDHDAVLAAVAGHDVILNAAAYTRVDDAESDEGSAYAINATGVENLARAAAATQARLITISTDYVFKGDARRPYAEEAPHDPINAYGRSKAAGERLAFAAHPGGTTIVRTAWLYGAGGSNFISTILRLARSGQTIGVVSDQIGQPTWTHDLAAQIVALLDADAPAGVYHGTSSGSTTWYELARSALELAGLDPEQITPTVSADTPRPAPRPAYSVLGHARWPQIGLAPIRAWEEGLAEAWTQGTFQEGTR